MSLTPHLALLPEPGETRRDFFAAAREIVAGRQALRDQALRSVSGVRFSGMDPIIPEVPTVEDAALELERRHAVKAAFELTPRGRFWVAVNALGELGYGEADTLANIYSRSLSDPDAVLEDRHYDAIGRALRILNGIDHSHAREGVAALADLMARPLARAA